MFYRLFRDSVKWAARPSYWLETPEQRRRRLRRQRGWR